MQGFTSPRSPSFRYLYGTMDGPIKQGQRTLGTQLLKRRRLHPGTQTVEERRLHFHVPFHEPLRSWSKLRCYDFLSWLGCTLSAPSTATPCSGVRLRRPSRKVFRRQLPGEGFSPLISSLCLPCFTVLIQIRIYTHHEYCTLEHRNRAP